MSSSVDSSILWSIIAAEPILTKVEDFLTNADEPCLQQKLDKLQKDAGLALQEDLAGDAFEDYAERDKDFSGPAMIAAYEPVTSERLEILTQVQHALEAHGSQVYEEYSCFLTTLRKAQPCAVMAAAVPSSAPSP